VKLLVQKGQIEILHGGSVSPDEQVCTADDIIDNMSVTREWLLEEFGI